MHYESLYDFSFRPARLVELVWPEFSGPTYYRWLSLMRLDDSGAWANSIYMGMVPLVAAAAAGVLIASRSPRVRPWLVVLGLALLTSIGGLGAVGLWRNIV